MAKHCEMIIDYLTQDCEDFQYFDNHGRLIRCKDCAFYEGENNCMHPDNMGLAYPKDDSYCSYAAFKS